MLSKILFKVSLFTKLEDKVIMIRSFKCIDEFDDIRVTDIFDY
jgi:hypothetical protein